MQGIENPTLTPSARAALAEAARQSEIERAQQAAEEAAPSRTPGVVASALAAPERRAPAGSPFRSLGGIVGTAQASTLPARRCPPAGPPPCRARCRRSAAGGNRWSVQVGAFASENLARVSANQARDSVADDGRADGGDTGAAGQFDALSRARHRPDAQRRRAGLRPAARPRRLHGGRAGRLNGRECVAPVKSGAVIAR